MLLLMMPLLRFFIYVDIFELMQLLHFHAHTHTQTHPFLLVTFFTSVHDQKSKTLFFSLNHFHIGGGLKFMPNPT